MGVGRRLNAGRSALGCRREPETHPQELFGAESLSKGLRRRGNRRARAGWAEAGKITGRPLQPIAPNQGEHHVRTVHGEGTARDLLRAVRGQPVRVALYRDRAPAAGPAARGQGVNQPLSALARLGGVDPEANRGAHHHPREGFDQRGPAAFERVQAGAGVCRGRGGAAGAQAYRHGTSAAGAAARREVLCVGDFAGAGPEAGADSRRAGARDAGESSAAAAAARVEPAGRVQPRPDAGGDGRAARSPGRPRRRAGARDADSVPEHEEQPGADRRAGRGQDGDRRGAGADASPTARCRAFWPTSACWRWTCR